MKEKIFDLMKDETIKLKLNRYQSRLGSPWQMLILQAVENLHKLVQLGEVAPTEADAVKTLLLPQLTEENWDKQATTQALVQMARLQVQAETEEGDQALAESVRILTAICNTLS